LEESYRVAAAAASSGHEALVFGAPGVTGEDVAERVDHDRPVSEEVREAAWFVSSVASDDD
jgi:hypothetical protein